MVDFQAFHEKVVTYNIKSLSLCKNKDLIGIITDDDTIIIKRVSHQPKKIVSIDETIKASTMCFKNEGDGIGIGSYEGLIKIYTLSSDFLRLYCEISLHSAPISTMKWHSFSHEFLPPNYTISKYISIPQDPEPLSKLSILLNLDENNKISMIVNGVYPLAYFDLKIGSIESLDFTNNLNRLHCITYKTGCYLDTYDVSVLSKKSKQIQEVSNIYRMAQQLFKILDKGIKDVVKEGTTSTNTFISRYLNGIEDSLKKSGNTSNVEELLAQCAGTGVISPCLSKFIKEEMQNTKLITSYEEKLNTQVKNCQIALIQDCKSSINGLLFYLTTLINYSKVPSYAPLGLSIGILQELVTSLGSLLQKVVETMGLLSNAHSDIKNTLHWLHNWNIKLVKEDEQVEAPEEWPVNLKQLIKYLESNSSLYFCELNSYLKKNLNQNFKDAYYLWESVSKSIPGSIPRYFFQHSSVKLSDSNYTECEMTAGDDKIILLMFLGLCTEVFSITDKGIVTNKLYFDIVPRHLSYHSKCRKIIASGVQGSNSLLNVYDEAGNTINSVKYNGEEITAFAFNTDRAIACLVTNERTLRLFDLEEA